jgi:uncharacterized protein DUF5677
MDLMKWLWSPWGTHCKRKAGAFPWTAPNREPIGDWEELWWWWNIAFVRVAGRLFRAIELLNTDDMSDAAMLPLRSLFELVANQGYMAQDPESRAAECADADLRIRERLIDRLDEAPASSPRT